MTGEEVRNHSRLSALLARYEKGLNEMEHESHKYKGTVDVEGLIRGQRERIHKVYTELKRFHQDMNEKYRKP